MKTKKILILFLIFFAAAFFLTAGAQTNENSESHTVSEEAEGKEIWQKLQNKERVCSDLTDEDFERLGEYFMGQMLLNKHEAMNKMMENMMGKEWEENMHIVMGKRMSGCESNVSFPQGSEGFMGMMQMPHMMNNSGNFNSSNWPMWRHGQNMMNWGGFGLGFGIIGVILMILWWVLIIIAIVLLIKWLLGKTREEGKSSPLNALSILKERYARGEINKEEYEEKRKELKD